MKVYTPKQLQELLGVGEETAYRIMRDYGFRIGYTHRSPLRITEEQLERWANRKEENCESLPNIQRD